MSNATQYDYEARLKKSGQTPFTEVVTASSTSEARRVAEDMYSGWKCESANRC